MKKIIYLIFFICLTGLVAGYIAPDHNAVNLVFNTGYTPPDHNAINLVFGVVAVDDCTYSGSGNWNIDCGQNCTVQIATNVLNNTINITGHGSIKFNASITNRSWDIKGVMSSTQCAVECLPGVDCLE